LSESRCPSPVDSGLATQDFVLRTLYSGLCTQHFRLIH
jgi:hypothetical protein